MVQTLTTHQSSVSSVRPSSGTVRPRDTEAPTHGRILVVDDDDVVRRATCRLLRRSGFTCVPASNAQEARQHLETGEYQLMLVDVSMPGESGLEFSRSILETRPDIAVIIATGINSPEIAQQAFDSGVYGFICKPFEMNEVVINVWNALRRRTLEIENRHHREMLEVKVAERTAALQHAIEQLELAERHVRRSQAETIHRLSKAAEFRDNETARHIDRMSRYCEIIARGIGMDEDQTSLIRMASPLHDVGKIGTPDQILLKPGRLEPSEFEIMKQHAEIGYRILAGSSSELLNMAATIAWTHHEKVDGTGYPRGLHGDQIPIEGRIAAVADVFDALTSVRVYKPAMSNEKSLEILREGRGKHFDADILDAFLRSMDLVTNIQATFKDS